MAHLGHPLVGDEAYGGSVLALPNLPGPGAAAAPPARFARQVPPHQPVLTWTELKTGICSDLDGTQMESALTQTELTGAKGACTTWIKLEQKPTCIQVVTDSRGTRTQIALTRTELDD